MIALLLLSNSCFAYDMEYLDRETLSAPYSIEYKMETRTMNVSAYTASIEECGKDDGIGAYGIKMEEGMVASDDLPKGTIVIINGKEYIVMDRFGGRYRDRLDIYMTSRGDAIRWGRQQIDVTIKARP